MSSWLVSLCPSCVWRCPTVTLGGATCHQVSAWPSQEWWPVGLVTLSGTLIVSGMAHANSGELADHLLFVFSPFSPVINICWFPVKIIRERDLFISHPHLTSCRWQGTASCEQIYFWHIPPDIMSLARNCILYAGPFLWHIPAWNHVVLVLTRDRKSVVKTNKFC